MWNKCVSSQSTKIFSMASSTLHYCVIVSIRNYINDSIDYNSSRMDEFEKIFSREYDRREGKYDTPSYMSVDTLESQVGKVMHGDLEKEVKDAERKISQLQRSLKPMRKRLMSLRGKEQEDMLAKIKDVKEIISNHKAYVESYRQRTKRPLGMDAKL